MSSTDDELHFLNCDTPTSEIIPDAGELEGTSTQRRAPWTKANSVDPQHAGITLGLKFLDGTAAQRQAVLDCAREWTTVLGDHVRFKEHARGIPVTFTGGTNKWSGGKLFLPSVKGADRASRRTALHELGHVLGMSHEHFHPGLSIRWKQPQAIADLINAKHGLAWTVGMVRFNITEQGGRIACPVRAPFDARSIMTYEVDRNWTADGAFELKANFDISDGDRACVRALFGL